MDTIYSFLTGGLTQAHWWQVVIYALVMTHITIVGVTIFLHRSQAHRGLDMHPALMHFFRFWLWMTTGMVTKEWVSIHRKHHAKCEKEGDPHSPILFGIWKVLFRGAELYRIEAANKETLDRFGHGTPDDWLERNLYAKHSLTGVLIMLVIDLALFGAVGLTVWAVQMAWIPFWAAGVVNGVGHYWGYRNYNCPDTSTNVFPWGFVIGGEELHNNHHAYGSSAKFSAKWFEIDVGWGYINVLRMLGLVKIKKVAPKLKLDPGARTIDLRTLHGVITHRYEIMARYAEVMSKAARDEISRIQSQAERIRLSRVRSSLGCSEEMLKPDELAEMDSTIAQHPMLSTLVQMRRELGRLWESSSASSEQLVSDLQAWCQRARQSGIAGLDQFVSRLTRYAA